MPCKEKGFSFLGIPIYENACAKNNRKAIEEASDVEKKRIEEESDKQRRREHTNRVRARNEQQALSSAFRNADGTNPSESIAAAGFGALGTIGAAAAPIGIAAATGGSSLIGDILGSGGFFGSPVPGASPISSNVILIGGAVLLAVVALNSSGSQ